MIAFRDAALYRGSLELFSHATFSLHARWRVGLIGQNGTGKSSLFAMLLGQIHVDAGEATVAHDWRISHMAQEVDALERSALDYVLDGDLALREAEMHIADDADHVDPMQIAHWHQQYDQLGGYTAKSRAQSLLAGLGFSQSQQTQPVRSFSGGWRIRLNLARTLYQPSELLLLDEPTNHLDLEAVLWLQDWLKQYQGTLVLISHDREFLDDVCSHCLHLHQKELTLYTGNYSAFERQRAERMAQQQAGYVKQQAQRAHLEDFVRRFRAKATKAKQAQSRLKALERMNVIALAHDDSPFAFNLPASEKTSSPLLTVKFADLGYGDTVVLGKVNFSLQPGDRIGLLGPNGAGKSTLIKMLTGEVRQLTGKRLPGEHLNIGYFAQHQLEALDLKASPLMHLQRLSPTMKEQTLRDFLGGFGFAGDEALETVATFSGGEKARLALAILAWQRPNLLLMDEPTNHLDLDMREALAMALQAFEGAVILVSHDRHLLASTVDEFWLVADGKVQPFDGDLDDYALWLKQRTADAAQQARADHKPVVEQRKADASVVVKKMKLSYKEQKELDGLPDHISALETEQHQLSEQLCDPTVFSDVAKVMQVQARLAQIEVELAYALTRWEVLEAMV